MFAVLLIFVNFHSIDAASQSKKGHVKSITQFTSDVQKGCHALITIVDLMENVNVISTDVGICSILGNALVTGNIILFRGDELINPPPPPAGGTWADPVFNVKFITLFNRTT